MDLISKNTLLVYLSLIFVTILNLQKINLNNVPNSYSKDVLKLDHLYC